MQWLLMEECRNASDLASCVHVDFESVSNALAVVKSRAGTRVDWLARPSRMRL